MIKFMEPEVNVRCRKSDSDILKKAIEPAVNEYKALMKREVKVFKDREVPCKIIIDEGKFLPEFHEDEGSESCLGGIVMHCKKGRIVCSNTLDDRLQLVYQEAIPEIRKVLFPSFKKSTEHKAKPQEKKHH